jgi:hypothetical protein
MSSEAELAAKNAVIASFDEAVPLVSVAITLIELGGVITGGVISTGLTGVVGEVGFVGEVLSLPPPQPIKIMLNARYINLIFIP